MNKKTISIIIISACAVFICATSIFFIRNANIKKEKELNVAFFGVEEKTEEYIRSTIEENYDGKVNIKTLENLNLDEKSIKKIDILFCWEGQDSKKLEEFAKDIPGKAIGALPNSLKSQSEKALPLLVDPFVLDFYTPAGNKENLEYPATFEEFEKYLYDVSGQVFSPFFCQGGDDKTLLALVGSIIQAKYGVDGYKEYIQSVKNKKVLENEAVIEVLDVLKKWAEKGLVHPQWFIAKDNDVQFFAEDKQIGVLFTSLSGHRKIRYNIIREFEMIGFPNFEQKGKAVPHGIVSSKLVCMNFNAPVKCRGVLTKLVSENIQSGLSNVSMLGPVALRGESYDIQADDARFMTAACEGGSLVIEKNDTAAVEIRGYLKK